MGALPLQLETEGSPFQPVLHANPHRTFPGGGWFFYWTIHKKVIFLRDATLVGLFIVFVRARFVCLYAC